MRLVLKALFAFWLGFLLLFTLRSVSEDVSNIWPSLARRVPLTLLGSGLFWAIALILRRIDPRSLPSRFGWVAILSVPAGILFAAANTPALHLLSIPLGEGCKAGAACNMPLTTLMVIEYSGNWAFVFAAWGMFYLALQGNANALAAERRASEAREAAKAAELAALRSQVSPHFLFNALNSLGALIDRGDPAARLMVNEMSDLLRYGLASGLVDDVELDDEIEMQRRYLEIERRRFGERLQLRIDLDDAVRRARVPSLLLQPLVENAVKHGVGSTSAQVHVQLTARPGAAPGTLILTVEDDSPWSQSENGMGIGLRNVSDRLRTRYDGAAVLTTGPLPNAGYRTRIVMPLVIG